VEDGFVAAIGSIADINSQIVNPIIKVLIAASVIYFLYGVLKYFVGSRERADGQEASEGKNHLLYGIIGMAITVSAFGLVNLIANFVGQVGK
jgi:hypothetical protein